MSLIKSYSYAINLLASVTTIVIGILSMDTFLLSAVSFLAWAVSPYLFSTFIIKRSTRHVAVMIATGLSLVMATGGIFLLIDAMYIQSDAQSAMAFAVIPMYQWGMLLIAALLIFLTNKKN